MSLVRAEQVDTFLAALRDKYFAGLISAGRLGEDALPTALFASKPASGAAILKLKFDAAI